MTEERNHEGSGSSRPSISISKSGIAVQGLTAILVMLVLAILVGLGYILDRAISNAGLKLDRVHDEVAKIEPLALRVGNLEAAVKTAISTAEEADRRSRQVEALQMTISAHGKRVRKLAQCVKSRSRCLSLDTDDI